MNAIFPMPAISAAPHRHALQFEELDRKEKPELPLQLLHRAAGCEYEVFEMRDGDGFGGGLRLIHCAAGSRSTHRAGSGAQVDLEHDMAITRDDFCARHHSA